jgi:hypothetical protein
VHQTFPVRVDAVELNTLASQARDRQCSSALGKPMAISDADCEVEPLELADFEDGDPPELAHFGIELAKLCRISVLISHSPYQCLCLALFWFSRPYI